MAHPNGADGIAELEPGSTEEAVFLAMQAIYARTLAGEVDAVTTAMLPDVTLWDSEMDVLAFGASHLLKLREAHPVDNTSVNLEALDASEAVVDVWGDTALMRHILTVRFRETELPDVRIRNTSVWRLVDGHWRMAHNHEDVWQTN